MNCRHTQIGFIALWFFVSSLAAVVSAQDRDAIIAKAKEEKLFVYYSTTDIRDGTAMVHAFQEEISLCRTQAAALRALRQGVQRHLRLEMTESLETAR